MTSEPTIFLLLRAFSTNTITTFCWPQYSDLCENQTYSTTCCQNTSNWNTQADPLTDAIYSEEWLLLTDYPSPSVEPSSQTNGGDYKDTVTQSATTSKGHIPREHLAVIHAYHFDFDTSCARWQLWLPCQILIITRPCHLVGKEPIPLAQQPWNTVITITIAWVSHFN